MTRGCPYRCGFCSAPIQNGKSVRAHSLDYISKWIKHLYINKGIRLINIIDDNFTFNIEYAKEFCRKMLKLDLEALKFSTPNGIRVQRTDTELLILMKQAGWEHIIVAPESGSPNTLKRMRKGLQLGVIEQKVKEIKNIGLKVHGIFLVGYPDETPEDIKLTQNLLRRCKFNMVYINNFQLLPGTDIYNELVKKGEISDCLLPQNYSDGVRVYTPKTLENYNFPLFVLRNYFYVLFNPFTNLFYIIQLINISMLIKKFVKNIKSMVCGFTG